MKPTYIRVGKPKTITRAPATVLPPTQGAAPNPADPASGDVVTYTDLAGNPTVDFPNGIVAGDYAIYWVRAETGTVTTPTGWTLLESASPFTPTDYLFGKVVTSADVTAGNFSVTVAGVNRGYVLRVDGTGSNWSTTPPTPTVPSLASSTASQPDSPAATPGSAGTYWSIIGFHSNDSPSTTWDDPNDPAYQPPPSGYTNLAFLDAGGGGNYHGHLAYRLVDVTTSEDPAAGWHGMSVTRGWVAFTLLLPFPTSSDPTVVGWPVTASDIDTESATDGQVLTSDGAGNAAWEDPVAADLSTSSIDELSDVDTTTAAPADGQVLKWSSADSEWQPAAATSALDTHIWRPLLDDEGAIVTDDEGAAVMGFGPA